MPDEHALAEGGEHQAAVARVHVEEERRQAEEEVHGGEAPTGMTERGGEDAEGVAASGPRKARC